MDAGAGGGGYTQEIIGRGISKKVVAIEADEKNFRILESRAKACGGCVETHHSFLEDASVEPGSMDAVICNQVLEHIEDHHRAAQKLVDSLSPGGILVASVPRSPVALPQAEHVRDGYTEGEFGDLFESKGMEVLGFDWFYTEETQKVRSKIRSLTKYKLFPPKFLYSVTEMKMTPEQRHERKPMGLIVICRKK